ncbi:class I SAM-dependent methyltransferase [Halostagnicola sp. A-GB9-2]|uniref:class I SAM-dependent methyltransferase n=1 Tax=Halostagnicola sp. A-GB9-2 TaxID=3048066 RepID=UPI0024BFBA50|nr:class I SAM-dependent methyltransferase [Halostagnicola sp. A-GB9-2]MDJ1432186.1 methyltransferase domain-containing protein [Halostagnicola sp. A-GB9-2]
MSDSLYDGTIDWTRYWEDADRNDRKDASASADLIVGPLREFFEQRGVPGSYADVGCGPGAAVFETAEWYPETTVVGYDSAEPILEENREKAHRGLRGNISFERTVLPEFDPDQQFDVISAFYTLCYVDEVDQALVNLFDAVAPGGYLLFTYHNRYAQSIFESIAESPHEYLDETSPWDPDHFADRFELLLAGENLLSYRRIHDVLETWPQSIWSIAGKADRYDAWRQNPLVFVPK